MNILRKDKNVRSGLKVNLRGMCWLTGLVICVLPSHLGSESLTLSTYYPAPLGVYSELITTGKTILARDWTGSIGIGTSDPFPTSKLHVSGGPIYVSDPGGNAGVFIEGSRILDKGDGIMRIRSSGNVIAFDDADNVGIGTTNPTVKLDVQGGPIYASKPDATISRLGLQNTLRQWTLSAYGTDFAPNGAFVIADETAPAVRMVIDTSGNVGIGMTSPGYRLGVAGNTRLNNAFLGDVGHGSSWAGFAHYGSANTAGYALLQRNDGLYTLINKKSGGGYIGFRVDNANKMVILANGNVGIGTTSPNQKLQVAGDIRATRHWFRIGHKGYTGHLYANDFGCGHSGGVQIASHNGVELCFVGTPKK